jgi:hypothetical protein
MIRLGVQVLFYLSLAGSLVEAAEVPEARGKDTRVESSAAKLLSLTPESQAFWQKKPELLSKVREERAILVSVRSESAPNDQVRFLMAGAGAVSRSRDFCFRLSQKYAKLKEISEHFKQVDFDPGARMLFIVTEALGYEARMAMRITPVTGDQRSELQWEVVQGHFKGMTGWIGFEQIDSQKTEMSLQARYEAAELPLPKFLVGFALEVVLQQVAGKMRAYIEAQPDSAI